MTPIVLTWNDQIELFLPFDKKIFDTIFVLYLVLGKKVKEAAKIELKEIDINLN